MAEDENKQPTPPTPASVEEMAAFLAKRRPPDDVTVELAFGDGDEKRVTELHFKRSHAAFTRYAREAYGAGGDPVGAAAQFLIDCAVEAERAVIAAFVDAYPVNAVDLTAQLLELYGFEGIEAKIKNS